MSHVTLKWKGDELWLGSVRLGGVRAGVLVSGFLFVSEAEPHVSEPYELKDDARQDFERHVRDLLAKAGAP